jgi:hypothetical protein
MTSYPYPHGVPLDDPNLELYQHVHAIDHDMTSTNMAISIARGAFAAGHPGNTDAARMAMMGPAAAAAVQATMNPFVDDAIGCDEAAEEHSAGALRCAQDAKEHADRRCRLPEEHVTLSDGSSQTRSQVRVGLELRMGAAAQREARGDLEHLATQPGPGARLIVGPVLALIEIFLLIWPVTNASWGDPKSVAYVAGLVVVFLLMNDQLPRLAGTAARDNREVREAARELTSVAITAAQASDVSEGREVSGQVDGRRVAEAKRKAIAICLLFGLILAIYAAVMFTRVLRLAAPLGSPAFSVLAATLITAFTTGAPAVMALRWSRGNALGDQLREYGAITADSRIRAEGLHDLSLEAVRASGQFAELALRQLEQAGQIVSDGYRIVAVGLQKAARILDQDAVLAPSPENLFPVGRPIRDHTNGNLSRATATLAQAHRMLARPGPFEPGGPAPNPWKARTASRRAVPDPALVDPAQLGPLHQPGTRVPWFRRRYALVAGVVVVAAVAVTVLLLVA